MSRLAEVPPKHGKEWAQIAKAPDLLEHIIDILSASNYQEGVEILTELAERANADKTGELEKAIITFLNCPKALYGIHRLEAMDEAKAALKAEIAKLSKEVEKDKKK